MTDSNDDKLVQLMYETIKSLADAEKAKSELELKQAELKITMANLEMFRLAKNANSEEKAATCSPRCDQDTIVVNGSTSYTKDNFSINGFGYTLNWSKK